MDPIRRFAPLVLIGMLLGAGLGFAAHTLTGTTYTSYVSVLVSPISGDPVDGLGTSGVRVDMATEAEVATSLLVAERANDLLAGEPPAKDPRDLLLQVDTAVRGTRIIEMAFTAGEPDIAQRGAAAFADAFLAYRNELATSQLEVSSGRLAERIAQLQLELTDVSTRRAEVPESQREGAAYAALVINEQTLLDELSVNQGRLADLRAVITDDAVVLDSASLPRSPSSLGLTTLVVGGAAAGFVLCAGLALMLDAARRRNEDDEFARTHAVRHVLDTAAADVAAPAPASPHPGLAAAVAPLAAAAPVADTPAEPIAAPLPDAAGWAPVDGVPPEPAAAPAEAPWPMPADPGVTVAETDRWAPPAHEVPVAPITEPAPWGAPATDDGTVASAIAGGTDASPPWSAPDAPADGWTPPAFGAEPVPPSDHDLIRPQTSDYPAVGADEGLDAIPPPFTAAAPPAAPFGADSPEDPFAAAETPRPEPFGATDTPMPDPFAVGEDVDDVWGRPDNGDMGDSWSSAPDTSAGVTPAGEVVGTDDLWAAPLSGSDQDAWAGIVEAAGGATEGGESAFSTAWDAPGTAGEDPWAAPAPGPWEAAPSGADATGGAAETSEPIDLDELLQERASESVAQLGEHLTNAVDVERRAVVVVDGGDGAAVPVAVAMAAHLAAAGRRTLLVDPRGEALATSTPGRYDVRDHPALEVLVGDAASDHVTLVADAAGEDTMVVFAGAAIESPLVGADGDWAGAIVIATNGVANPTSIPGDAFERVMGSRHPLIGIVSVMPRPALAPPGN
ncbi:MAG: hypothetical protein ACE367_24645 [Acidimicrobiales bacterium]